MRFLIPNLISKIFCLVWILEQLLPRSTLCPTYSWIRWRYACVIVSINTVQHVQEILSFCEEWKTLWEWTRLLTQTERRKKLKCISSIENWETWHDFEHVYCLVTHYLCRNWKFKGSWNFFVNLIWTPPKVPTT